VRRTALAAGVVVALGVVVWLASTTGKDDGERRPRPAAKAEGAPTKAARTSDSTPRARPRTPPPTDPANAPPPPPVKTADEARAELRAVMDELDAIERRGETLGQKEWVERYKRGTEALQALVRALDSSDPAAQEEIGRSNEEFRKQLARVQAR
jgi:hypothetical protein